jgi:ribose transport system substrate-binding protein
MKNITRRLAIGAVALAAFAAMPAMAQNKVVLGVAIPAATHGFTGGIVYWANQAKKDLEKAHPGLQVIVKTAGGAPEQANQLQDLQTVNKINALVIFPFESASLTKPVAQVKSKGVYVTVVDRGLTDTSAQDAYVSGDNTAFGRIPAEYLVKAMGGKGNLVAMRGIATTLDNERMDAFNAVLKANPGMNLLDAKYANWNRDDAFKVMQDYLTRFKSIDAVWAADD